MSLFAALALALLAPAEPLETRVLAQFDAHCATLDTAEQMVARIAAKGWQAFTPEPGSELARMLDYTRTVDTPADWQIDNWAFARGADREIMVVITRAGSSGMFSLECRSIALGATQRPDPAIIERWAGKPAARKFDQSGVMGWGWEPGLRPTHESTLFAYVAPDSPMRGEFPLLGMIAVASR